MRLLHCLLTLPLAVTALAATALVAQAPARTNTFDRARLARLARLDTALQSSLDSGVIAGAVALVLRDGEVVYERAIGWADREARRPMRTDAVFRIASQTKALTSVAVMMLVEEGRIALADPVQRWMPTFPRTITIQHLLTHTAGISYGTDARIAEQYAAVGLGPATGFGWYFADKAEPICASMDKLGSLPFTSPPGEAFVYGYNTDILGCVVERVSGMSLDAFLKRRITGPLGMTDTHFFLPREKRDRLVTVYRADSTGRVVRADTGKRGQGHYIDGPRQSFSGGAGLLSTAHDYATFLQMLLNGGEYRGARLLAPHTVQVMTANHVGTKYNANGQGFSLGFAVTERLGALGLNSVGTYGWGGAYASAYQVDPAEGLVMVLMLQTVPSRADIRTRFPTLVYQALIPTRPASAASRP